MTAQQTLKALYEFTASQYEELKSDWNKLPKHEKQRLPFSLFIIGVFGSVIEDYEKKNVGTKKGV